MHKYHDCYATVKARGLTEKEYTLTIHKAPVLRGGVENGKGMFKSGIELSEYKSNSWQSELKRMLSAEKSIGFDDIGGLRGKLDNQLTGDAYGYTFSRYPSFSLTFIRKNKEAYKVLSQMPEELTEEELNSKRFDSSISRSRNIIRQYAANNPWDYFVTLTIAPEKWGLKMDLSSLPEVKKKVLKFFQNYAQRRGVDFKYLLVPEFHKSGRVHFHGLMKGISEDDLFINENGHLDFRPYRDSFGFCTMSPLKDQDRVSSYITKYIEKDMFGGERFLPNTHLYYASKGLKKDEVICKGTYHTSIDEFIQAGYECYDFGFCYKVKSNDVEALKSAVHPFVRFTEGINTHWHSRRAVFKAYIRGKGVYDDDDVFNNKISTFLQHGIISFEESIRLWRDDWSCKPPVGPVVKPIFESRKDEYAQQSLNGWCKREIARSC